MGIERREVMSGRKEIIDQSKWRWAIQIKEMGTWLGFWAIEDLVSNNAKVNEFYEVNDQSNRASRKIKLRRVQDRRHRR